MQNWRFDVKKELRESVYKKFAGHCAYCGCEITVKTMQIDHIIPQRLYGFGDKSKIPNYDVNDYENLNPSRRQCNFYKGAENLQNFRNMVFTIADRLSNIFIFKLALKYGIIEIKNPANKFYFEKELT